MEFDGEIIHQGCKFFFFVGGVAAAIAAASGLGKRHLYTLDPCFHVISPEDSAQNKP
jgi:hypothetical protein